MKSMSRRNFVQLAGAAYLGSSLSSEAEAEGQAASAPAPRAPRLGTVAGVGAGMTVEAAIERVHRLGLPLCQIGYEHLTMADVHPLLEALKKYDIEVTAVSEHNPGPRIFNFYEGPLTVGIIPPHNPNRRARIEALKLAADFARACNIPAIHTHLGFIPENPNDPIYPQAITAIREVAQHCKDQGCMLLCETGEETPVAMLRMIHDVGTGNVFINLDTANLIMCDTGNPVDAMDVIGHYVRGVHAKDGLFPTDPRNFGKEVPIGQGKVDFPVVFRQLREVNYSGPITIEREVEGPQKDRDILQSEGYLRELIARAYA
jgi:sugar phosphate isomerase/epimerase